VGLRPGKEAVKTLEVSCISGFGGLVVSMLASGTQDSGFKHGRSRRIFRAKISFLQRGSKAVCPMSQLCGMLKNPAITWKSDCLAEFDRPFRAHNSSFR
jgi:hypothetical protein